MPLLGASNALFMRCVASSHYIPDLLFCMLASRESRYKKFLVWITQWLFLKNYIGFMDIYMYTLGFLFYYLMPLGNMENINLDSVSI